MSRLWGFLVSAAGLDWTYLIVKAGNLGLKDFPIVIKSF